jgi:hypothetical protein
MKRVMAVALLVPVLACGDRREADVDFGGEDLGPDRYSMVSQEGEVKMGLTDEFVYVSLSDEAVETARSEMREGAEKEGVAGMVGGIVEKTVGKALGFRARFAVAEIEDIRWEDGEMRIVFVDPDRRLDERSFHVDDRPLTEAFSQEDVEAFAREFRALKGERGHAQ